MAVYTKISKNEINVFLKNYKLGGIVKFSGIKEGIENTNYLLQTEKGKFILTIYEKRVNTKDLPFFMKLMTSLYNADFKCPRPIMNKNGDYICKISGKNAALISFVKGSAKKILNPENCYKIGVETAKLHKITKNLPIKRKNNLSLHSWGLLFNKVEKDCSTIHRNLSGIIKSSLKEIKKSWPKNLPSGIIHADLFSDNIFFKDEKLTGIIDFYFSCNDFYCFEIAVCLNALCFDGTKENLSFNVTKARKFIKGYTSIRKLSKKERKYLKVLSQGASMRFLLTRVFDYLNLNKGALLTVKDPLEYLKRLEFHNSVKSFEDYCI
tara:strand:+ start:2019 stop:2987 length:969 start_codon:yes stop_codon:yes gene_type:complete